MVAPSTIDNLITGYSNMVGACMLKILVEHPSEELDALNVAYSIKQKMQFCKASPALCSLPVPTTDNKALYEVNKRLVYLQSISADKIRPEIEDEIKELIKYRRYCVKPGGGIRYFPDERKKAYYMLKNAYKRFQKKAIRDGHQKEIELIQAGLKMGIKISLLLPKTG